MSDHLPVLKVRLFGGFSASYGEIPVSFGRNTTTKAMKLLQILLYHGDTGISRDKLLDELYGREELADAANNLRVTAHRLKKIIVDAGLPSHDYINIKKGMILSILVDTFISKISLPMQPVPEIGSISVA